MTTTPFTAVCDCPCPVHLRRRRTDYTEAGCLCAITCPTQPMTLLAKQWGCALFLDRDGDLFAVHSLRNGNWDWENAGIFDTCGDHYAASEAIGAHLRLIAEILHHSNN